MVDLRAKWVRLNLGVLIWESWETLLEVSAESVGAPCKFSNVKMLRW